MIYEEKLITYKNLNIGQEIQGYKDGSLSSNFIAFVKAINPSFVIVEMWKRGGIEEKINSSAMFKVKLTEDEFRQKYKNKADEIVKNIQKKLNRDEIGYHEMWNAWISYDPYEMAKYCIKEKIEIVGCCYDIIPKISFTGTMLDVGICVEYEDGERFWCHYRSETIEDMLRNYNKEQNDE